MNSRERVLAAISHQPPDRVPVDLGATTVTGFTVHAYARLRAALGRAGGPIRVIDPVQMLAEVELPVLEALVFATPWGISNSSSPDFMCALLVEKDDAHERLEEWSNRIVQGLARVLDAIKPHVQVILFSGDAPGVSDVGRCRASGNPGMALHQSPPGHLSFAPSHHRSGCGTGAAAIGCRCRRARRLRECPH